MNIEPLPGDPDGSEGVDHATVWWIPTDDEYEIAAMQTLTADGRHLHNVVAVQWPAESNQDSDTKTVLRLIMTQQDARDFAAGLYATANWLRRYEAKHN